MLIRLLQNFSSISLELDAFPHGTLPPDEFKLAPGRKGVEKVWPKATLTLYLAVRNQHLLHMFIITHRRTSRVVCG